MLDDAHLPTELPPGLQVVCDALTIPISIADPDHHDTPLIYVNPAFETLTQYTAAEAIGQNCRLLKGHLTDRTATDEIADVCRRRSSDAFCVINYRKDGSIFFNLLSIQPLHVDRHRTLLMGCQHDFRPTQTGGTLAQTSALIDRAQRSLRHGTRAGPHHVNIHDTYRLDMIAMRYGAAFTRVKNMLVKNSSIRMTDGTAAEREDAFSASGFAGRDPEHLARLLN